MPPGAPLIIQCAVTGSQDADVERRPNLPVTTEAIVAEALSAWRAGAAVIHLLLHPRRRPRAHWAERVARLAAELQRPVATPDAARAVLGVRARSARQGIDA